MNAKGAAIQGSLAALGLLAAYGTWQREPERAPGEVIALEVSGSELQKVRYGDGSKWVELERRPEADGPRVWLRLSARPDAKPPVPQREVRGNEAANRLWERFAPLRASRALGTLAPAKLKELGLESPKKKLSLRARGEEHAFSVGTSPYGVSDPYVKAERDGRVWVLGGSVLPDLDSAAVRLVERGLHSWKPGDWDGLKIAAGGKQRELVQLGGERPAQSQLAPRSAPDKPDELVKNWHDKIARLMATEILGKGETPAAGEPALALRIDYTAKGKAVGFLELGRVQPKPPATPLAAGHPVVAPVEIYARSEQTAGWVKVPASADELLKEAVKVAAE